LVATIFLVLGSKRAKPDIPLFRACLFALFVLLLAVGLFRQGQSGFVFSEGSAMVQVSVLVVVSLFAVLTLMQRLSKPNERLVAIAVGLAPVVFVATNIGLDMLGIEPPASGVSEAVPPAQLLSFLGLTIDRSAFPLSRSYNNFGVIAGASLAVSLVLTRDGERLTRSAGVLGAVLSVYALLRVDTRAALLFAVLAAAACTVTPATFRRSIAWVPLLIPVSAFIVLTITSLLGSTAFGGELTRTRGSDLASASGREFVWYPVLTFLQQENPWFGFGAFGHVVSGVSGGYAARFGGRPDALLISTHNFGLQTILDVGYVGLVVVVALLVLSLRNSALGSPTVESFPDAAICAALLFFVLAGFSEATPTLYAPEAFFAWVPMVIWGLRNRERIDARDPVPGGRSTVRREPA